MTENNIQKYDAIIIGTGQGGYPLAKDLPAAGWKTAVIEKGAIGGTCVNTGCTPTKTMVASARVAHLASRGPEYGVNIGPVTIDLKKVRERKRDIVDDFSGGSERRLESIEGLDVIRGEGRFIGPQTIEVALNDGGTLQLESEKIFINTGTRSFTPPIEGLDSVPYLDNASIMELGEVPKHLIVLGGGYIGLEFGQMFRRFGSDVTVVQRGAQLTREDPDVADEIKNILEEEGMNILLNSEAVKVQQNDDKIELILKTSDGEKIVTGSHLLVAVGRTPNTDMLNLESAGVEVNQRGHIPVNDKLETNVPGIYVIGDAKGGPAFTHISYDDYRVIKKNLVDGGDVSIKDRLVPYAMFIDPQLGRVGLSESEARAQGKNILVAKIPMTYVARALEMDETRGFMKAVIDADTNQILGCAVLGIEGGEIMSVLQMAMIGNVPYTVIRDSAFAHPTLSESLNNLFMSLDW